MYHTQSNSFSMLFSMANGGGAGGYRGNYDDGEMYSFSNSGHSAASVDCTLSLGTPSTRGGGAAAASEASNHHHHQEKKRSSLMSNFGWNILPSKHTPPPPPQPKSSRGGSNGGSGGGGGDPLLARRCANCDTTSTPLWRNGPRGPKSLCNACGIRFKKEERRATAAAASSNGGGAAHGSHHVDTTQQYMMNNATWASQTPQKTPCYSSAAAYGNEFRFMEDGGGGGDSSDTSGMQFLSWRFNVADRPSLVHDFTR